MSKNELIEEKGALLINSNLLLRAEKPTISILEMKSNDDRSIENSTKPPTSTSSNSTKIEVTESDLAGFIDENNWF